MTMEERTEVIVGVLGQWASGKSTAAKTLIRYLGGQQEVIFIDDRALLAGHAVNRILESEDAKVKRTVEADGRKRYEGELSTVWIGPGEELEDVDLSNLLFDLHQDVYDKVPAGAPNWLDSVRLELGHQILAGLGDNKPIVIEAGFGTNTEPRGENPFSHTISDLFDRLAEAGVKPGLVKWILVEASYETRAERNNKRPDTVPAVEFDRFAADGGDLDPDQQKEYEEQGATIIRVSNEHDDVERFKADVTAAFKELFEASTNYTNEHQ